MNSVNIIRRLQNDYVLTINCFASVSYDEFEDLISVTGVGSIRYHPNGYWVTKIGPFITVFTDFLPPHAPLNPCVDNPLVAVSLMVGFFGEECVKIWAHGVKNLANLEKDLGASLESVNDGSWYSYGSLRVST